MAYRVFGLARNSAETFDTGGSNVSSTFSGSHRPWRATGRRSETLEGETSCAGRQPPMFPAAAGDGAETLDTGASNVFLSVSLTPSTTICRFPRTVVCADLSRARPLTRRPERPGSPVRQTRGSPVCARRTDPNTYPTMQRASGARGRRYRNAYATKITALPKLWMPAGPSSVFSFPDPTVAVPETPTKR